jgi:hypothetical protein
MKPSFLRCFQSLLAYAVLAGTSPCYPPLKGRSPTCYSPVRHCTHPLRNFLVRLACIRRAASVRSEPGSNSPSFFYFSEFNFILNFSSNFVSRRNSQVFSGTFSLILNPIFFAEYRVFFYLYLIFKELNRRNRMLVNLKFMVNLFLLFFFTVFRSFDFLDLLLSKNIQEGHHNILANFILQLIISIFYHSATHNFFFFLELFA